MLLKPKIKSKKLGDLGEKLAVKFLRKKRYKIIERNYLKPWGELDIVAIAPDKSLVIVEVKTMREYFRDGIKPEDHLTHTKLHRLKRTASLYAGERQDLIKDVVGWRIDLVAIVMGEEDKPVSVAHYENI